MKNSTKSEGTGTEFPFRVMAFAVALAVGAGASASAAEEPKKKAHKHKAGTEAPLETDEAADDNAVAAGIGGMQAHANSANGKLRMPSAEEAKEMSKALEQLTNRSTEGLEMVSHDNGALSVDLSGRFLNVSLATINEDGTVSTRCTTSAKDAPEPATKAAKPDSKGGHLDEK